MVPLRVPPLEAAPLAPSPFASLVLRENKLRCLAWMQQREQGAEDPVCAIFDWFELLGEYAHGNPGLMQVKIDASYRGAGGVLTSGAREGERFAAAAVRKTERP